MPLVGAIAIVVALIIATLPGGTAVTPTTTRAAAPAATQTSGQPQSQASELVVQGRIFAVRRGATSLVEVRGPGLPNGRLLVRVASTARILVPYQGSLVNATPSNLAAGQVANVTLRNGETMSDGAIAVSVRVATASVSRSVTSQA